MHFFDRYEDGDQYMAKTKILKVTDIY